MRGSLLVGLVLGILTALWVLGGDRRARADEKAPKPGPPAAEEERLVGAFAHRIDPKLNEDAKRRREPIGPALRWLAAHQSDDGRFGTVEFAEWCDGKHAPIARQPRGAGASAEHDVGVTSLALLAFLGTGHSHRGRHPHVKTVRRALAYLRAQQQTDGLIGLPSQPRYVYGHALGTLAFIEAYGMGRKDERSEPARRAVQYILRAQNPYFGWRYGVQPDESDSSVTAFMMDALHAARLVDEHEDRNDRLAVFSVPAGAYEGALDWYDKMIDSDFSSVGYQLRGTPREPETYERLTRVWDQARPAAYALELVRTGSLVKSRWVYRVRRHEKANKTLIRLADRLFGKRRLLARTRALPTWDDDGEHVDLVFWQAGAQLAVELDTDRAKAWLKQLFRVIREKQRRDGDPCTYLGSWDPVGAYGAWGGRVYATAMAVLCLAAPERYVRVYGTRVPAKKRRR